MERTLINIDDSTKAPVTLSNILFTGLKICFRHWVLDWDWDLD